MTHSPPAPGQQAWHAMAATDALAALRSGADGLTATEAQLRLQTHGPNRLACARSRPALLRLLLQFHNLLIYVLLGSAGIALLLGHVIDALVIMAVVVANALIGFVQEGRAEQALDAIRTMIDPRASVVRDAARTTVPAEAVVPGDLVLLDAGDRIPADLRLIRARNLRLDEAALTGESIAVEKGLEPVAGDAALGDRSSMAYSGTFVAAGMGAGVAVATGAATELGRISSLIGMIEALKTPLVRQMDQFARQITLVTLGVAAAVFGYAVLVRGHPVGDAFMAMVGLAVAVIPEGLPAVMTIALAIGVQRMATRHAIIRRLPAVETLGSVTTICSDKTGTLTRNEMTARAVVTCGGVFDVGGVGYAPHGAISIAGRDIEVADDPALLALTLAALLCNDARLSLTGTSWLVDGDPMEGALVSLAVKAGHEVDLVRRQMPRRDEIPFDARHRFMASLHHRHDDGATIYVKGAPERLVAMCASQRGPAGDEPIDPDRWHDKVGTQAAQGQRVLALAAKVAEPGQESLSFAQVEGGLTLLGLVGLIDPPREEAVAAVADCRAAGIAVKMITGDHAATALAIARQLGLADDPQVVAGRELDAMDDTTLREVVRTTAVFARTSPEHKLRLVEALQAEGAVVAMTGDGVNDAPALKRADVGVAMGRKGTEAAKEVAAMVLADDNFASIVAAVREGRTVYDNLLKVIGWTLPTNGGVALAIIAAILVDVTLPMTPVQILWVNLVSAVALGLTLAFEPTEPGTMLRPPRRPDAAILSGRLLWQVALVSVLFVAGAFGMFFWTLQRGLPLEAARTIVVNTLVVMEIAYLFSVRFVHGSSLTWQGVLGTPAVLIGVATVTAAQLAFTYLPFMNALFATRPIAVRDGIAILVVGASLLAIVEIEKGLSRRPLARNF